MDWEIAQLAGSFGLVLYAIGAVFRGRGARLLGPRSRMCFGHDAARLVPDADLGWVTISGTRYGLAEALSATRLYAVTLRRVRLLASCGPLFQALVA